MRREVRHDLSCVLSCRNLCRAKMNPRHGMNVPKIKENAPYTYIIPRSLETHSITTKQRQKHNFERLGATSHSGAKESSINDSLLMFSFSYSIVYVYEA